MTSRSLPLAEVREPPPRIRRHTVMAAVVGGYLLAALVIVLAHRWLAAPEWLALHLVGLGAATNAVLVWSRHFAQALLHARVSSERSAHLRLGALNAGVAAVLVGVSVPWHPVAVAGAAVVVGVVGWHAASLVWMVRRHRLPGPLRSVVGFYVAAALTLVIGAGFGGALASGRLRDNSTVQQRLHLAHAELNLFGWVALAVLGTAVTLWPAVLRTRMVDRAPRYARYTLLLCSAGLAGLVAGILAGSTLVAVAGGAAYALGVLVAIVPMLRTLPGRSSRSPAAWWIGASVCWLLAGVVLDTVRIGTTSTVDDVLHPLVPLVALGLIVQVLVGALTFLLPVTIGGGPRGNRQLAGVLESWWVPRFGVANVGVALVVAGPAAGARVAGWVLALGGFGAFLPLLAVGLLQRWPGRRRTGTLDA